MEGPGRWTSQVAGRGYFVPYGRAQHVQCRHARHCRPAGVQEHITRKRIASEAGISHVWPLIESSLSRTAVRIGKARSRSR